MKNYNIQHKLYMMHIVTARSLISVLVCVLVYIKTIWYIQHSIIHHSYNFFFTFSFSHKKGESKQVGLFFLSFGVKKHKKTLRDPPK